MTTKSDDTLELIAYNTIQLTMYDDIVDGEAYHIGIEAERLGMDWVLSQSRRVITFEVPEHDSLADIIDIMGDLSLTESIGKIQMMTDLEPQWEYDHMSLGGL